MPLERMRKQRITSVVAGVGIVLLQGVVLVLGECLDDNDCLNGGVCEMPPEVGYEARPNAVCRCSPGFGGPNCAEACPLSCQNGGSCKIQEGVDGAAGASCDCEGVDFEGLLCEVPFQRCPDGYTLCFAGGECVKYAGDNREEVQYRCYCPDGRGGEACESSAGPDDGKSDGATDQQQQQQPPKDWSDVNKYARPTEHPEASEQAGSSAGEDFVEDWSGEFWKDSDVKSSPHSSAMIKFAIAMVIVALVIVVTVVVCCSCRQKMKRQGCETKQSPGFTTWPKKSGAVYSGDGNTVPKSNVHETEDPVASRPEIV